MPTLSVLPLRIKLDFKFIIYSDESLSVCPLDKLRPCFESEPSPPPSWEFTRCLSSNPRPAMFLFIQATGILGPNWVIIFPSSGPLKLPSPLSDFAFINSLKLFRLKSLRNRSDIVFWEATTAHIIMRRATSWQKFPSSYLLSVKNYSNVLSILLIKSRLSILRSDANIF